VEVKELDLGKKKVIEKEEGKEETFILELLD